MTCLDSLLLRLNGAFSALLFVAVGLAWAPAWAEGVGQRQVLALYDGRETDSADNTRLHRLAEMPLNHLGYVVTYHDLARGLPPEELAGRIVTWFADTVPDEPGYAAWIAQQLDQGARIVMLGDSGLRPQSAAPVLRRLGVQTSGTVVITRTARVLWYDDTLVGYERAPGGVLAPFPMVETLSDQVVTHLALGLPDGRNSAVITSAPRGAWVPDGYGVQDVGDAGYQWIVDPFALFPLGFGDTDPRPAPDVTTAWGRRIYFSHIDGDGWNNLSHLRSPEGRALSAAEVVRDVLIKPYPGLPVTVGVIAGDTDPTLGGTETAATVARNLFALPQVEVAVHGYTHPYDWSYFERYDRADELAQMAAQTGEPVAPDSAPWRRLITGLWPGLGMPAAAAPPSYAAEAAILPRAYLARAFTLAEEIDGAIARTASLAPEGKTPALYLWTGDTRPFEAAVAATRRAGVMNMNGGNGRFDALFPSITNLAPIARQVGAERQIYAPAANESLYTDQWNGPFSGQVLLAQTLDNTEMPRRLMPFNLYYHMFSGERQASVAALRNLLERAADGTHFPLRASEYAAIAEGFYTTKVVSVAANTWEISERGALHTLRIDAPGDLWPDFHHSRGVIGARAINGALYVALDPAQPVVRLVLTRHPPSAPMLVESGWALSDLRRQGCGFTVMAQGFGDGQMTWDGLDEGWLSVRAQRGGATIWSGTVAVIDGLVRIDLPFDALQPVVITTLCHETQP